MGKENARKNIMNQISKQVIKPNNDTENVQTPIIQNSASEDVVESTTNYNETSDRQIQKNLTSKIIKIKSRNNIKEPAKNIKNVQSLTKKQKEKTDRSQQVITSPTVGVTLL